MIVLVSLRSYGASLRSEGAERLPRRRRVFANTSSRLGRKAFVPSGLVFSACFGDFGELRNSRCFPPAHPLCIATSGRSPCLLRRAPSPSGSAFVAPLLRSVAWSPEAFGFRAGLRACAVLVSARAQSLRPFGTCLFGLLRRLRRIKKFPLLPARPPASHLKLRAFALSPLRARKPALSLVFLAGRGVFAFACLRSELGVSATLHLLAYRRALSVSPLLAEPPCFAAGSLLGASALLRLRFSLRASSLRLRGLGVVSTQSTPQTFQNNVPATLLLRF